IPGAQEFNIVNSGAKPSKLAPLLTMLNSCAPGIGVVNIDNGFGAAILAGQIIRTGEKLVNRRSQESGVRSQEGTRRSFKV
ncbi:MAG: hypothetical protein F6K34_07300, partial [Okeania sp. SIO4D6]|nr:hypothetical protein [Okeania sp. SIO4D6]